MTINEVPGDPQGELPDKASRGVCPHCFRQYYKVFVKETASHVTYICRKCRKVISKKEKK